ncbi:hypothetical protein [Streptosporangium sp. NPDC000509]|uniref:hypothetical protein n=1 Tax=Streptosporangium sp. NPDC000509 TaxID=3366186 RepID=UPI0036B7A1A8
MNAREPDWAYVARSLLKVLAVATALFLALSAVDRVLWLFDFDERSVLVYGTAAQIANPDKRLSYGHGDGGGLLETTYTLRGEPRRAGPSGDETEYKITKDLFGSVRAPFLDEPSGSLFAAIDSVSWEPDVGRQATEKAKKTIDGLPQTLEAVAVVEFAHSMTAEQLVAFNRRQKTCAEGGVSYIYATSFFDDSSDPPSMNAVVWDRYMVMEDSRDRLPYHCETEPEASLVQFRRWVGLLEEGDDLEEFELSRDWLVGAAEEGVAYGLVLDGWKLADLRNLLDNPEILTIELVDVAFDLN